MAITMKRAGAASLTRARARDNNGIDTADLERITAEQLATLREQWRTLSLRVARGRVRSEDLDFAWHEPDWDDDPETWPVIAKMLWLGVRLRLVEQRIETAVFGHFDGKPEWCPSCNDGRALPDGWRQATCPDHSNVVGMTQRFATDLGLRVAS